MCSVLSFLQLQTPSYVVVDAVRGFESPGSKFSGGYIDSVDKFNAVMISDIFTLLFLCFKLEYILKFLLTFLLFFLTDV